MKPSVLFFGVAALPALGTAAGAALVGEIGASNDEQRIATVPARGGELTLASPADTYVYEFDWMPDGSGFVATTAKGDGDANW